MNKENFKIDFNRLLFLFSIVTFIFLSVTALCSHSLYIDEINAWNIAANVKFFDLFKLMKYEGHLFVWFAILMPFAKYNLFYPYSMQIINWLFCLGAIMIMWKYAPFNSYAKACITLSLPFKIYSLFARCYSVGIFLLFIIASLYPNRFKHPVIYSSLIIIAANTSVMALVGAFVFGILFLYDLIKLRKIYHISNKILSVVLLIFLFGSGVVLMQLFDFSIPCYAVNSDFYNYNTHFINFYLNKPVDVIHLVFVALYSFLLIFAGKFFIKSTKIFFFLFITHLILITVFAKIYAGECWHYCFIFLYFILSIWIYCSENKINTKFQKLYIGLFTLFCFMLIIFPSNYKKFHGSHEDLRYYIENNITKFSSSKIFFYPNYVFTKEIVPPLAEYKLDMYDSYGNSINSFEAFKIQWRDGNIDFKMLKDKMDNDNYTYIITDSSHNSMLLNNIKLYSKSAGLKIVLYKCILPGFIYIVTKL